MPAGDAAALLAGLRQDLATTNSDEDLPPGLVSRLEALPASTLEQIADRLTPEDDFRLAALVAEQAFASGGETTALRLLGERVIAGDDLSGLFFAWLHADEAKLALRRYVGISRYLLNRNPDLSPAQKEVVNRFLCDDSLGQPLDTCTPDAVLRRLEQLEQQIASTPAGAKQGESPQ